MTTPEEQNVFQKVSDATGTVVTPANAISLVGFASSVHGTGNLGSWAGLTETGAGFAADLLDGKVARATGTSSPLGEAVDATLDKIKTGYLAARLLVEGRASVGLIGPVIAQNLTNAGITMYDRRVNKEPRVHPNKTGKWGTFIQNSGLILSAVGTKVSEKHPSAGRTVRTAGTTIGLAGVAMSFVASKQYLQAALYGEEL